VYKLTEKLITWQKDQVLNTANIVLNDLIDNAKKTNTEPSQVISGFIETVIKDDGTLQVQTPRLQLIASALLILNALQLNKLPFLNGSAEVFFSKVTQVELEAAIVYLENSTGIKLNFQ